MKTKVPFFILALLLPWLWNACSDDETTSNYDPALPVEITGFVPDTGGYRTDFIIEGNNFGTDLSKIKVFFNDKEALLMNSKGNVIYCMVPKQPGEKSKITIQVDEQKVTYENKEFVYVIRANVTTITGKAKESGNKDGKVSEALYNQCSYVGIDREENLFVSEITGRTRLVSTSQDKVMTLQGSNVLNQPVFNSDKSCVYYMTDGAPYQLYRMDAGTQWMLEVVGKMATGGYFHAPFFTGDDRYMHVVKNSGEILRMDLADYLSKGKKIVPKDVITVGRVHPGQLQNYLSVYNPRDGYVYCAGHKDNAIYRFKINGNEQVEVNLYAGGNGMGWLDGDALDAKFNEPRGMAVDQNGENLYIADEKNHCIRKINLLTNIVSTVAGQHGKAGYQDGDPETTALFNQPRGVCLDKDDYIYVAEIGNHDIRRIAIE